MAHLTCFNHGRRVHVADRLVMHRNDRSKCESASVKIGKRFWSVGELRYIIPAVSLKTGELKTDSFTKEA